MSVLIRGMKMPKDCENCPMLDDNGDYPTCILTWTSQGYNWNPLGQRMPDCPLVEVPKHGRLIDADDVFHVLTSYYHHSTDFQHEALKEALARVSTIIQAEDGDQ